MAAVEQALKEFGKIDILINCESLLSEARGLPFFFRKNTGLYYSQRKGQVFEKRGGKF